MIEWIKRLFHHHTWVILQLNDVNQDGVKVGTKYHQQCSICGKIRAKVL